MHVQFAQEDSSGMSKSLHDGGVFLRESILE